MEEKSVRWKARRGMKELDVMLERYLDLRWADASATERAAFAALLEEQDPVVWDLLLARTAATDPDRADVVERIRSLSGLRATP